MSDLEAHNPYYLTHELRPGYLYVNVRGETMSYEIARAYWDDIIELYEQTSCERLLVEKDIPDELNVVDLFKIAAEISTSGFWGVKLALCDRHASKKINDFGEVVTTNRGMKLKTFADVKKAEDWLLAD